MLIRRIKLADFRNFRESVFEFESGINVVVGPNGAGKTNLIEAIAYLSIPRSFRGVHDGSLIRWNAPGFRLEGLVEDRITSHWIKAMLTPGKKRIEIDSHPIKSYRELFSTFVSFVVSQHDHEFIDGAPGYRRKRLDKLISTFWPEYFNHLLSYRSALEQRNFVLKNEIDDRILRSIDSKIILHGNRLIEMRKQFIQLISSRFSGISERLTGKKSSIIYAPSTDKLDEKLMREMLPEEIKRGFTLIGPHRDDYLITIEGHAASDVASEGEKRLLVTALVIAVGDLWQNQRGERPVLLLDEPLSLLDSTRIDRFVALIEGQSIITAVRHLDIEANIIPIER